MQQPSNNSHQGKRDKRGKEKPPTSLTVCLDKAQAALEGTIINTGKMAMLTPVFPVNK